MLVLRGGSMSEQRRLGIYEMREQFAQHFQATSSCFRDEPHVNRYIDMPYTRTQEGFASLGANHFPAYTVEHLHDSAALNAYFYVPIDPC